MAALDPEEARAVIDPALKLMIDAVQRYDGYIVQSTGNGVFALFGAPLAMRIIRGVQFTIVCGYRRGCAPRPSG
jgi:class 3 adenylate cyclase